jgi:hypothetical protein
VATTKRGRRGYGTGSLRVESSSWIGSWYGADGRKIRRKVGPARTPGERDGLTKSQAEERFRKMRDAERPRASAERVTMVEAGEELSRRLEIRGRKKSHRMTVESACATTSRPSSGGPSSARSSRETLSAISPSS